MKKDQQILLTPVAFVINDRNETKDDFWGGIISEIRLADHLSAEALEGIDTFSHLEIIFHFNKMDPNAIEKGKSHPRGNPAFPLTDIFAQRKKKRPNHIGLTTVKLVRKEGRSLFVEGLDADNGTPVLDIKPVIKEFLPAGEIRQPAWATELMKNYWK